LPAYFPPNPIVPFTPLFLTLMSSALAFVFVANLLSSERTIRDYLSAPLFIACPTLYYIYNFNTINYGIGIGFLVSAIGLNLFVYKEGSIRWLAIPLLAFSIGIYQAMVPWLVILFGLYLIGVIIKHEAQTPKRLISLVYQFALMLIAAIGLHYAILYTLYKILNISSSGYINAYFNLEFRWAYFEKILQGISNKMGQYYLGHPEVYIYSIKSLALLFSICFFAVLILIITSRKKTGIKILGLFTLIILIVLPFSLDLIMGGHMPTRAMLGIPLVFSGLTFFAWPRQNKFLKVSLVLLVIVCSFQFININNRLAFSNDMVWQADRELTLRLLSRIDAIYSEKSGLEPGRLMALEIVGSHSWPESPVMVRKETIGASFYSWEGGNIFRVIPFMRTMGHDKFRPASMPQRRAIMEKADTMPVWPYKGSIAIFEGLVVIKFGPYTHQQLHRLCKPDRRINNVCRIIKGEESGLKLVSKDEGAFNVSEENLLYQLKPLENNFSSGSIKILERAEGLLTFEALTRDPKIILPQIKISNEATARMTIVIDTPVSTNMQLFYKYKNDVNYSGQRMVQVYLTPGINRLSFWVPGKLLQKPLRIVPGGHPGKYSIHNLKIYQVKP